MRLKSLIFQGLIGLFILYLFIVKIGINRILSVFSEINIIYLPLVIILMVTTTLIYPLSLVALYYPLQSRRVSLKKFFKLRLVTQMFGNITPNKIGEFYLFFKLKKKYKMHLLPIGYIFVLDKAISLIFALIVSVIGFLILVKDASLAATTAILVVIFVAIIIMLPYILKKIKKYFTLIGVNFDRNMLDELYNFIIKKFKGNTKCILINFGLTGLSFFITALLGKVTLLALNTPIPLMKYFVIVNMVTVISLIPLNIMGFGIKEVSSIYLLELVGISGDIAASSVILIFIVRYVAYSGIYVIAKYGGKP